MALHRVSQAMQNAIIESFKGRLRYELLNETLFTSAAQARVALGCWRADYSEARPHLQLGRKSERPHNPGMTAALSGAPSQFRPDPRRAGRSSGIAISPCCRASVLSLIFRTLYLVDESNAVSIRRYIRIVGNFFTNLYVLEGAQQSLMTTAAAGEREFGEQSRHALIDFPRDSSIVRRMACFSVRDSPSG